MFSNIKERIKETLGSILNSRLITLIIVFCLTYSILIGKLFYLQIVKGEHYLENYELLIRKTKEIPATRGNIYDRNGNLLAYNELAYSVTIEDTFPTNLERSEKNAELNRVLDKVLSIVESNGDSVINNFGISLSSSGEYQFTQSSETQRLRFVADLYGKRKITDLSKEQKEQTAADLIHYLCADKRYGYGLDDTNHTPDYILKMVTMRYAISLNSYQKYIAITLASDVSDETAAAIMENLDILNGVDIQEDSLRRYTDGIYFSGIIGYTGQISQKEYDALDESQKSRYSLSDIVGKSGLEQSFDQILQGEKGKTTIYVDNLGKVTGTLDRTEPEAGNDVYLTIDKNLQKSTYHLLEEKLAGIVLSKLRNILVYDPSNTKDAKEIIIPVSSAYHNLIANEVLDAGHFSREDAKPTEKKVFSVFEDKKASILQKIMGELRDKNASAYRDLSDEMKSYMDYICDTVLTQNTGILDSSRIDKTDATYVSWAKNEVISLNAYLNYAISQNWIDSSKLEGSSYSSSEEIYNDVLKYLEEYLIEDSGFDKLLYQYLIQSGRVTGAQICAIVYEQDVLPMDEEAYDKLLSGQKSAYNWLREKIQSLEITPGQLALEPCSAGAVVSDPNTGEILACVTYPGYDNNRLANDMDSAYYKALSLGTSRTFYNRATQEKTAPGSTFKMVSSVAGLTEGVVTSGTPLSCHGPFTKIKPSPKCWRYPGSHGSLNVVQAISVSCNNYFYEVGFRLGQDGSGNYDSDLGVEVLGKYAEMFGLGENTGIEIPESLPQISDQDAVRSAIGQGSHNYTVSQLNRYISAVANEGDLYCLSLIDKTTDSDGKLIKDYQPTLSRELTEISSSTWDKVHEGMIAMADKSTVFRNMEFRVAGKTGTAQQNRLHPDHTLFVGFAPAEEPKLAVAVRIANGYNSNYPAEIGRDIMKIYFDPKCADELITGQAGKLGAANTGD